ncbi:MAG: ABC-F family ATP-binding cassette domain-containing protein [bacterium]|nr:ABC-F family ATP-binding cassette domain-containing protein [bacterium]
MIQLDQVKRQFGPRVLFENLSWFIKRGARLGLVGPNGAGKTTLLRMLAGEEPPDDGAVHRPGRLNVGYLPQEVETVSGGSVLSTVLSGFGQITELERELEQLEIRMSELLPDDPRAEELAAQYGRVRHRFEDLEGDRLESRAKAILSGLGVSVASFHDPVDTLSGGWRMRVVLARMLLGLPDLLLLDEPTNHLDLEAIGWLEEFLDTYEGAFVVVSHDRYFLNRMARAIVELERGRIQEYAGNYEDFLRARELSEEQRQKAERHQAREVAKVERFIERFRYKNTKAKQVQSRVKALEKLERVEGGERTRTIRFGFPPAPRSGDIVVRAEEVSKRFDSTIVYDEMDLLLRRGDRVALVGPNGAGKSTLLKLLSGGVQPDAGRLELGHKVLIHYYAQHQLDALDPAATVLEEMERVAPAGEMPRLRKLLGCFLFSGDDVQKRVGVLSGGEKARLALARMLVHPSNLLLLDEPTNHLDLKSREVLEDALNEYDGTLVIVSHDRYFVNRVATTIGEVGRGVIDLHAGDYDEYLQWKQGRGDEAASEPSADPDLVADERRARKRQDAEERNRLYRERKAVQDRLDPIEREIARLEAVVGEQEVLQASSVVYSNPERAQEVGKTKSEAEARLAELYAEWERLAADLP